MKHATLLALTALLAAGTARAAVVSYAAPACALAENGCVNTAPLLDPGLGTLNAATVSFAGTVRGSFSGEVAYIQPAVVYLTAYLVSDLFGAEQYLAFGSEFAASVTYPAGGGYVVTFDAPFSAGPVDITGARIFSGDPTYILRGGLTAFNNPGTGFGAPVFDGTATFTYDYTPAAVPEPGTLALLGFGLAGLAVSRRRS